MRWAALAGATALLLGGCATAPENHYYVLSADGPTVPSARSPSKDTIMLATLRLPGVLDRTQMVEGTGPHSVAVLEYDRWAEPLDQMISRVLADDLAVRSGVRAGRDRHIAVEIDAFMADTAGVARLTGRWHELPRTDGTGPGVGRRFSFSALADPGRREEVAAAMSALLGQLADQIAGNAT
jgi:uncharacterized protein